MALYVGNKKYSVIRQTNLNNRDIAITANGTYTAGSDYSGFNVVRVDVPITLKNQIVTPSTAVQTLGVPQGYDGYGTLTINPVEYTIDANIQPQNIKKGVSILNVEGTLEYTSTTLTITPTTHAQTYNATTQNVNGFSSVSIAAVTHAIDSNIQANNIVKGVSILGIDGNADIVNNTTKTITQNGTYTPEIQYTGFS